MRIISDIIEYCSNNMPRYNTSVSVVTIWVKRVPTVFSSSIYYADGIEYIKAAINAGLKIDDFAPRLSFFFALA